MGLIFACVQAGNYCGRGAQYVNTLFDMVARSLPQTTPFRFVCLTDDPEGLHPEIETMALPDDLEGWYGKLYLFKRGLFPDGSRIVFMDLDTVIVGRLDEIVAYDGQFATLRDFYEPARVGPAVMLWKAGSFASSIWEEWVAEGKPRNEWGDLWWLNNLDQGRFSREVDKLQDLFPGAFVSYKKDCRDLPPKGARVVCFHGHPRPHDAKGWVERSWCVGGMIPADFEFHINTSREKVAENIRTACALPLPWLEIVPAHSGEVAIVGGGPSLPMMLEELRSRVAAGCKVYAVNGAASYLAQHGVRTDCHVVIDARPENARFVDGKAKSYAIASQCDPETFRRARHAVVVHMHTRDILDAIPPTMKPINLISSGNTVGLAALAISYCRGYRKHYLYGMDSSYEDAHHAYAQPENDADGIVRAETPDGRAFKAAPWMIEQVQAFQILSAQLAEDGCEIHVRSFGLLGHVAWLSMQEAAHA